jgi:DNA-binding XRE family transcriptional regulator
MSSIKEQIMAKAEFAFKNLPPPYDMGGDDTDESAVFGIGAQAENARLLPLLIRQTQSCAGGEVMDPKRFGPNLKLIMKTLDMSQTEIAEITGLTQAAISQILNGKREPTLQTICKILDRIPIKFERLVK